MQIDKARHKELLLDIFGKDNNPEFVLEANHLHRDRKRIQ